MKSVIIDEDVHKLLRIVAAESEKSIKEIVNEAILYIVKKHGKEIPKSLENYYANKIM
jgi:hypothetical protein